ncbi:MAG: sugar phosphate isomerase/epimerase family protein [Bryobacteraceae bacterium]
MKIGIFSRTYSRPTLDGVLDAVAAHELSHVHFNLKSAGEASLPGKIDDGLCARVRGAFQSRGFVMTSISGTFNAIHPGERERRVDTERACHLIGRSRELGTSVVTLCTGSRDPNDMWKRHPGNDLADAWADLLATLDRLLPAAQEQGVTLGVEPETNNVVNTAAKARLLLDELRSPHLKIILDGANLFESAAAPAMARTLEEAFDLLAPDVVMVHAKDLADPPSRPSQAAGKGALDWDTYCRLIVRNCKDVPVILHNLGENEVAGSIAFVKDRLTHAVS